MSLACYQSNLLDFGTFSSCTVPSVIFVASSDILFLFLFDVGVVGVSSLNLPSSLVATSSIYFVFVGMGTKVTLSWETVLCTTSLSNVTVYVVAFKT